MRYLFLNLFTSIIFLVALSLSLLLFFLPSAYFFPELLIINSSIISFTLPVHFCPPYTSLPTTSHCDPQEDYEELKQGGRDPVTLMDRISRYGGDLRVASLLFGDDVVLLASSDHDLHALGGNAGGRCILVILLTTGTASPLISPTASDWKWVAAPSKGVQVSLDLWVIFTWGVTWSVRSTDGFVLPQQ